MAAVRGGYLVPHEVRFVNGSIGHGVFATEFIPKGTPLWVPTKVVKFTHEQVAETLRGLSASAAHEYLRQAFVLASDLEHLCVNVDDTGRFTNHSSTPNCGFADFESDVVGAVVDGVGVDVRVSVALRDIAVGEEITVDYAGLGSPQWYKDLCALYGVLPTDEVARLGTT
eukprot:gnl/Spiro4/27337_TR13611_c0_g1_i1.p1 gnl/Spiro4/27337_TR13611_c0_g1~~gnl/Spiro4/27337_TR13611_c0_g1_i1.p1  ORF type:complete len:177 (-),score=45.82 gnl/Spiro4/27337_TR13611_c0_g1_i1:86-595(-)